mgnify:FL=1
MSSNKSMLYNVKNSISSASNKVKRAVSGPSNSNAVSANPVSANPVSANPLSSLGETPIQILKLVAIALVTFLLLYGLKYFLSNQQEKNI